MSYIQKYNRKDGFAYRIWYYEDGERKYKYYPPGVSYNDILTEKKCIDAKLAMQKAGLLKHDKRSKPIPLYKLAEWYYRQRLNDVSESTMKRQLYALRLLQEFLPSATLQTLSTEDLEDFKTHRLRSVSKEGVNHDLSDLKTVLNHAYKKDLLVDDFFKKIDPYKVDEKIPDIFEPEEIDRIEKCVYPAIAKLGFQIAKFTGMRRSEICGITWKDVKKNYIVLKKTKTKTHRTVPIHRELKTILHEHREYIRPDEDDRIVPLHPDTLTQYFRRAIKMAGLNQKGSVHILRHSLGAYMASVGMDLLEIAEMLGHKDLKMAKKYTRIAKTRLKNRIDELF